MSNTIFKGIATALITPFKADYSVDWDAYGRIIDFQLENDIDALVACGTTGEGPTLTDEDLIELTYGHPMMNISNTFGIGAMPRYAEDRKEIPLVPTADGPAGLRVREGRGVSPTFFPSGSTVAQTWNLPLVRRMGAAAAREIKENNIQVNTDETIAKLIAEVAAQRRVTEKVLEQNSELIAIIAGKKKEENQ